MDGRAFSTGGTLDQRVLRFGQFEIDLRTGELRRGGALVKIQQQPFKVLALLAGRAGELVTREELRQQIWGGDTYVDFDQGLNFCIKQIRAALGDHADTPCYV
ncbi:MAG TPA: winged helix-turn-helix domain-containing protein, partial [Methylomirabilota bacterium]|nr:winged helix-turn-helix domain-containing protein [Methylomirabilota bacterium]